jgi:hypothetical protein
MFRCEKDGEFTSLHSIKDIPPVMPCPMCGQPAPRGYCYPEDFVRSWTPPVSLEGRYTTQPYPQYGACTPDQAYSKERAEVERVNAKQSTDRWEVNRSVKHGRHAH